jgi:hypothetical protein
MGIRSSSIGSPPFSVAYKESTPLPLPESAYIVKDLSIMSLPPLHPKGRVIVGPLEQGAGHGFGLLSSPLDLL